MTRPVLDLELDLARERTLLPLLRTLHDDWLRDVRTEVAPALGPDASSWQRFAAVRYLDTTFQRRLRAEADAVEGLACVTSPRRGTALLAAAQLLDLLRHEVGELSQASASQQLVPPLLRLLVQQLEHWCADVEVALGWMRRDSMSPESLDRFLAVRADAVPPALH
jgi:hypothetical protein